MAQLSRETLEAGLDHVRAAPSGAGTVALLVRRPETGERELLDEAVLDTERGLVGDRWADAAHPNPDAQLTLMGIRAATLIADGEERVPLAGDQVYVDLDLGQQSLPTGTRLEVGTAVVEVSELPHLGCGKFSARFGDDAHAFVNSPEGKALRLRGVNVRIVESGVVRTGDHVRTVA